MKAMTALWMEPEIARISVIWIVVLVTALSASQDPLRITNLDCDNDFHSKMVCFWEVVSGSANCSSDFQLKYKDNVNNKIFHCQDLNNEYYENVRRPNKCICNIDGLTIIDEIYYIEVESKGQIVGKADIRMYTSVKPKRPSDLSVELTKSQNGVARWQTNHETSFIKNNLCFNIQFISKKDNKMELDRLLPQVESRFSFDKRSLTRGAEFRVRVRTRHTAQPKEMWSEWSPEVVFTNNYDLTLMDMKWVIITVSCIAVMLITVFCYLGITRTKKNWWSNIPDPAKSKLAKGKLIQQNILKPVGKPSHKKSCGNCLSQLVKAHAMSKQEPSTKEHPVKDYPNLTGDDMKRVTFEPEKVDIECCIRMYPREDKEEDIPLIVTDFSIDNMFSDILCNSSVKVDNSFGSFGCSFLRDNFQKTERHLQLSMVSQESGYQSYDSDDSPLDLKSDRPSSLYFDQSSLTQGDFSPYAPVCSIEGVKDDTFINSGYNSFACALAEVGCDISEGDNISLFSLGTTFCKPYYHHSMQNPKSILYSNTRSSQTQSYEGDFRPTSEYNDGAHTTGAPGYQSFNQAIHQGDTPSSTTCLVFDSGYKPFESLTRISTCSLDNVSGSSDGDHPYKDSVKNNEDLQTGTVIGGTYPWDETQRSDYHITEFNFYSKKYPSYPRTSEDVYKGSIKETSGVYYGMDKTLSESLAQEADKPLALTFDIRNLVNMQGLKMPLNLEFAGFPTTFSLDTAPIINLLDKKSLNINKGFPVKFENMSYFVPLYHLRATANGQSNSHLLVQQNNTDGEDNSYMKIALW